MYSSESDDDDDDEEFAAGDDDQEQLNDALFTACEDGNVSEVRKAISLGADINYCNTSRFNWTPLHINSLMGHSQVVSVLLGETSIVVDARDVDGDTPLHWSASEGYKEIAQMLVSAGALVDAVNEYGTTPLDNARQRGHSDVVDYLEGIAHHHQHSPSTDQPTPHPPPSADGLQ